jgi:hypothetical protein
MGQEVMCRARYEGKTSQGKALLETDYVLFRGDFRVKILFREMKTIEPCDGWLEIVSPNASLALQLGPAAEKWAHKILHPPSRLDKLGVKAGMRVTLTALKDDAIAAEIRERGATIGARGDIILLGAEKKAALAKLESLPIQADGAMWIVYPKGVKQITENDVLAAIRAAGLVDVKIASFSPTHTALKAVVPKSKRST